MTTFAEAAKVAKECDGTASPLPEYRSHKHVYALKIKEVISAPKPTIEELDAILNGNGREDIGGFIVPEDRFAPIAVSRDWLSKHEPQVGGYLVFYKDGYRSFSPAQAFEEGYTRV